MKIAIVTHYWHPHLGGIEQVAGTQARELVKLGHHVKVLTSDIPKDSQDNYIYDITRIKASNLMESLGIPYPVFYPSIVNQFCAVIEWADIIHSHGHPYISSLMAAYLSKKYNKPHLVSIHNSFIEYSSSFVNNIERLNDRIVGRYVIRNSRSVIAISPYISECVRKIDREIDPVVIYNGVDCSKYHPADDGDIAKIRSDLGLPNDRFICLSVGRLNYKKGIYKLIEIAKEVNDILICIVGSGPEEETLRDMIERFSISDKVRFLGKLCGENLEKIYRASDIFLLPSLTGEGLPTVVLEALASGLPVIATNTGGQVDIIKDFQNGNIVDVNNILKMGELINYYKENEDILKRCKIYSRKLALELLSIEANMSNLTSLYHNILENSNG